MITCSQCGAQNLPGMAYCENCGSPLAQQAQSAPTPAQTAAPQDASTQGAPVQSAQPQSADAQAVPAFSNVVDPAATELPQPVMPADQIPAGPDVNVPPPPGANVVAADASNDATATATAPPAQAPDASADAAPAIPLGPAPADQGTAAPAPPGAPAVSGAPAGTLVITFPSGQTFTTQGDEVNVGRADVAQSWHPELDVIPYGGGAPDLGVSRHHARIVRENGQYSVVDLGSTNGTYVNGKAAPYNQAIPLNDGDTLSFGALNTQVAVTK